MFSAGGVGGVNVDVPRGGVGGGANGEIPRGGGRWEWGHPTRGGGGVANGHVPHGCICQQKPVYRYFKVWPV